jgi:magnesium-protoporphyrin IX monomethyl ester (oxidative) cyclase
VSSPQGGFYKSRRNTPIVTSRGCPAKCYFCASTNIWGNQYRYRSAENIIDELKQLKQEYNIEEFQVQDDNFTMNKKRTLSVCRMLKDLNLYWSMPNGVALWALDEERIKAMSEAGCYYVIAAIESGNQRVLNDVVRKPLNLTKGIEICKTIKRYNIKLAGFFIIGFPDEKLEEVKDTFDYALKCDLDLASFSFATPLPSTDLWKQAEKENLFVDVFDLANVTYERPSLTSRNWSLEELQSCVNSLSRKFYFKTFIRHPGVILFRILDTLRRDPVKLIRIFASRFLGI